MFLNRKSASQWQENEAAGNIRIRLVGLVLYLEFFTDFPVIILCGKTGVIQICQSAGVETMNLMDSMRHQSFCRNLVH